MVGDNRTRKTRYLQLRLCVTSWFSCWSAFPELLPKLFFSLELFSELSSVIPSSLIATRKWVRKSVSCKYLLHLKVTKEVSFWSFRCIGQLFHKKSLVVVSLIDRKSLRSPLWWQVHVWSSRDESAEWDCRGLSWNSFDKKAEATKMFPSKTVEETEKNAEPTRWTIFGAFSSSEQQPEWSSFNQHVGDQWERFSKVAWYTWVVALFLQYIYIYILSFLSSLALWRSNSLNPWLILTLFPHNPQVFKKFILHFYIVVQSLLSNAWLFHGFLSKQHETKLASEILNFCGLLDPLTMKANKGKFCSKLYAQRILNGKTCYLHNQTPYKSSCRGLISSFPQNLQILVGELVRKWNVCYRHSFPFSFFSFLIHKASNIYPFNPIGFIIWICFKGCFVPFHVDEKEKSIGNSLLLLFYPPGLTLKEITRCWLLLVPPFLSVWKKSTRNQKVGWKAHILERYFLFRVEIVLFLKHLLFVMGGFD